MSSSLKKIKKLLEENNLLIDCKIDETFIEGISYDSREVKSNFLFFCKGANYKVEYLKKAIDSGAVCYISEKKYDSNINFLIVSDIRKAMALVSACFYNYAYKDLETVAITGTKGKTTVTYFIKNIIDEYINGKSAVISSIEVETGKRSEEAHLTTPEAPLLHELFYETKESGNKYLTMEVTSQAYKTSRVLGVHFSHGIFLNIAEDHISEAEHSDFYDYLGCKLELIKNVDDMLINKDMDFFETIESECKKNNVNYVTYGKDESSDFTYYNVEKCNEGFNFFVKTKNFDEEFSIKMSGRFNVENAVAAIAMASNMGIDLEIIKKGVENTVVKGRMNVFEKNGFTVIVDFAHNKFSFEKLFESVKADYPNRKIISLGGGTGGKAYKRREDFGRIVGKNSDFVVLTADDPQYEKVEDICDKIIKYLPEGTKYKVVPDRKTAVEEVINNAKPGDVILLLAKSEEEYQKINGECVYYESDLKIVKRMLDL